MKTRTKGKPKYKNLWIRTLGSSIRKDTKKRSSDSMNCSRSCRAPSRLASQPTTLRSSSEVEGGVKVDVGENEEKQHFSMRGGIIACCDRMNEKEREAGG